MKTVVTVRVAKAPDNAALFAELQEAAETALAPIAERMVEAAKANLRAANRPDAGNLGQSIDAVRVEGGYDVWALAAYALYVELGREPGRKAPPVDVMRNWVQTRLGLTGEEAESAAFLIGRAISEGGIPATHFMRDAGQSVPLDDIRRAVEEALK